MTFLSPSILWGMLAITIPIIIHLISLRHTRDTEFSTLRFIKSLKHETIRRLRIKQWLLVLLRTIAILCLILMFSRPLMTGTLTSKLGGYIESRAVIIVDNSASMAVHTGDGTLLDRAKSSLPAILKGLEGETTVELYQTNPPRKLFSGSHEEGRSIMTGVKGIVQTNMTDNLWTMIDSVLQMVEASEPNRECFIISDFQSAPSFAIDSLNPNSDWKYYCILQPKVENNISISEVSVLSQIKLPNHLVKLNTRVGNGGVTDKRNIPVELYLNNERVGQIVSQFEPSKFKDFMFQVYPGKTGIINGKIVIPDDDFPMDNFRNFDLVIPNQIAVKVIGQSMEELFLLDLALSAITGETELLLIDRDLSDDVERLFLSDIDILLLHNPTNLSNSAIEDLQRFLMNGGGLIWFVGNDLNQTDPVAWPSLLKLPELIKTRHLDGESFFSTLIVDENHSLFTDLNINNMNEELPQVFGYNEVRLQMNHTPLIKLNNGHPLLIESKAFGSSGFVFTSPLNLGWNDLSVKGLLVPLLHRMLILLGTKEFNVQPLLVGQDKIIDIKGDNINAEWVLMTPMENEIKLIPDYTNEKLLITQTSELGSYHVFADGNLFSSFSTVLSPHELPSIRIEGEKLTESLGVEQARIIQHTQHLESELKEIRYGRSIWRLLLFIALSCLVIESILGRPSTERLKTKE
tara:strand:- start:77 stop:2143 length:2067 start_codon:yes stop_codon:yes gene_type:complete